MCLILFAIQPTEKLRLVVAANRDEFYARPSSHADYWQDHPHVLAGRDLEMGGTWLGVTDHGRFAAVTNFRETPADTVPPRSRGELTSGFLTSNRPIKKYLEEIHKRGNEYRGFNLILDDGTDMYYFSNRDSNRASSIRKLEPGFYGLSNQLLDCNWPKVNQGRQKLSQIIHSESETESLHQGLFKLLFDKGDGEAFSNSFISTAEYGTCAATVLSISTTGEINFQEQGFSNNGKATRLSSYAFQAQ